MITTYLVVGNSRGELNALQDVMNVVTNFLEFVIRDGCQSSPMLTIPVTYM